jgi:DDE superfamily endonuclease
MNRCKKGRSLFMMKTERRRSSCMSCLSAGVPPARSLLSLALSSLIASECSPNVSMPLRISSSLTPGEARVVAQLISGKGLTKAASRLNIAIHAAITSYGLVTPLRACGPAGGSVAKGMKIISYRGYRFPPEIIQQAIWLYLRFTLSLRDVEDLAERGITVSYETVRRWVNHFGPMIAADLRKRRPKPHTTWHLDEVYLKIDGRMVYLWRAVMPRAKCLMCWSRAGGTSAPR